MTTKVKTKLSRRDKGLRYPVEYVAAELGVDRKTLERRCEAAGFHLNGAGLTFREAYSGLSQKAEKEAARHSREVAEAKSAEIDALNKQRMFVFKTDHENVVKDFAVQTRVIIENEKEIPLSARHKLIKKIAEIKPSVAEVSHK